MTNLKKLTGLLAGAVLGLGVSAASAYVIDFTDAGTGTTGSLYGGTVTWTMTSTGGKLTNTQAFDGSSAPLGTELSFDTDGYGVNDDEITTKPNRAESVVVTFSQAVLVDAFYFLDLFVAENSAYEIGVVTADGGTPVFVNAVDAVNAGLSGFASATFAPLSVVSLVFTMMGSDASLTKTDGALAGISLAPVPVPAAGLMLLGGLGGFAALRRRKKA